ncbi:MAG: hypothetical protein KJ601_07835 [Nanoarchaeota archaeon]|nr:hypothetical protein [Nanoarchaeota archaeon]MBU1703730.1 hypothetical protein [Nanoarchaeota archaeon]
MVKMMFVIVAILLIGGYIIKTGLDTDFGNSEDRKNFLWTMVNWLLKIGGNVKDTAGYAVSQDWNPEIPKNQTIVVDEIE